MCATLAFRTEFSFETLSPFFYLNHLIFHLKKSVEKARQRKRVEAREDHGLEKLIDLKCKMPEQSRVTVSERWLKARRRNGSPLRMTRGGKRKRRTVITREIKISRIFHEAPVRNSTVSRTSRKMCRSFLSREYFTLRALSAAVARMKIRKFHRMNISTENFSLKKLI